MKSEREVLESTLRAKLIRIVESKDIPTSEKILLLQEILKIIELKENQ